MIERVPQPSRSCPQCCFACGNFSLGERDCESGSALRTKQSFQLIAQEKAPFGASPLTPSLHCAGTRSLLASTRPLCQRPQVLTMLTASANPSASAERRCDCMKACCITSLCGWVRARVGIIWGPLPTLLFETLAAPLAMGGHHTTDEQGLRRSCARSGQETSFY